MDPTTNSQAVPLRRLVLVLLALCAIITVVVAVTVVQAHDEFPAWFCPIFVAGTMLLLAVVGAYVKGLRCGPSAQDRGAGSRWWVWFSLVTSVVCTSSLHGFYPFRPDVLTVWSRLPPQLELIHYNYVFTFASLLTVIGLALLFFRGRQRLASTGLVVLAGIMLIPNDDCRNPFNAPWIAWLGASPLMFLSNSVVLLIGYCALHGLWPKRSVLIMAGINVGVLLLGAGHITELVWGSGKTSLEKKLERERQRPPTSLSRLPIEGHASFYICSDARLGFKEGLPAIVCIGHTFQQPETILQFVGQFRSC